MGKTKNIFILAIIGAVLLVGGYVGASFMARNMAEQKVKEFFAGMDNVVRAEYGDVDVSLLSHEAVIHDLNLAVLGGRDIKVKKFVLSRYEEKDGLPYALKVRFSGVTLPVTPEYFNDSTADLRDMGYEELHCEYAMDYEYREKDKSFDLRNFSLAIEDAGRLGLSLQLGNVKFDDLVQGGPSAMLVAVQRATLRYDDDSLVSRAVKAAAREEGLDEQAYMDRLDTAIEAEVGRARDQGETFAAKVLEQLRRFMQNRKSFRLDAAPVEPVTLLQLLSLNNAAKVIDTLGVTVEAE